MTTMRVAALASALMLCLSGSALAQQSVADQPLLVRSLYEDCKGKNVDFCNGYLSGVANAMDMMRSYYPKFGDEYCPPPSGDISSYRAVFISWAERSELWRAKPYDGVFVAFWITWFCPNLGSDL